MRIVITGGTGLIGRPLAAALAERSHDVVVLSRAPERAGTLPPGVRAERWDGRTARGWDQLADGAGAIVNLAGENLAAGRWTPERRRAIRDSRRHSGEAVVAAVQAARHKPSVVIQASAVGYYGSHGDEEVTEETASGHDFPADVCREWEASTATVEAMGTRRVVIRTGIVLSTQGGALPRLVLPFRFFLGGPLGSGRQWYPWIHHADEVAAICFLIEHGEATGVYNLSAPHPVTNATLSQEIGRRLRRPSLLPVPAPALRLLLGDMSTVVLDGQKAVPARLQALDFPFRFPELATALDDLLA